jgi:hypothetical protein
LENSNFDKNKLIMDITEKRSDLVKRIVALDDLQIEKIYNEMIAVLQHNKPYQLTEEENFAIDQALDLDENGRMITKSQVVADAKVKYPNLKF